jgi:hypothetical protein
MNSNNIITQDNREAIENAVSEGKVLMIGNKRCKLVSVDFKEGNIKCLPLNTNKDMVNQVYETVPIQKILDNQYALEDGSKSRKYLSRKRKGKKSYKKKKYVKSNKSRRFRRSVRSRR